VHHSAASKSRGDDAVLSRLQLLNLRTLVVERRGVALGIGGMRDHSLLVSFLIECFSGQKWYVNQAILMPKKSV
jgi:hypothetical protein